MTPMDWLYWTIGVHRPARIDDEDLPSIEQMAVPSWEWLGLLAERYGIKNVSYKWPAETPAQWQYTDYNPPRTDPSPSDDCYVDGRCNGACEGYAVKETAHGGSTSCID